MKKCIALILSLMLLFSFTSCNSGDESTITSTETTGETDSTNVSNDTQLSNDAPLPNGDTKFRLGDDQTGFIARCDMKVSNGSGDYMFYRGALYYCDYRSQTTVPLCNKPDCKHDIDAYSSDCNAAFDESKFYYDKGIAYYDDSLYLLGKENGGNDDLSSNNSAKTISLFKVSKTGSAREEICTLFDTTDINTIGVFTVHRGCVFWSINADDGTKLYSMSLENKDRKRLVFESNKSAAGINRFMGVGNSLYFSYSYAVDDNYNEWEGGICRYDFETDKIYSLVNSYSCFTVADNRLFYLDSDIAPKKIFVCTLDGKNVKEFAPCPDNSWHIFNDSKYIYLSNSGNDNISSGEYKLSVMTFDGETVDTIEIPDSCELLVGATMQNIYMIDKGLKALDKSQIGTDKKEWRTIYSVSHDSGEVVLNK